MRTHLRTLVTIAIFALAAAALFGLQGPSAAQTAGVSVTPQTGGGCGCPKQTVCCFNCDGSFAYCGRSHAFCPECAAP